MKLCIIGTGYVGLVSGTCFADLGNKVYCVDNDINKIKKLNSGVSPIYEPGLDEIIKINRTSGRLIFTNDLKTAVLNSDIIFICVGTPNIKGTQSVNLSYVFKSIKEIAKVTSGKKIIVTKSTVPVSTGDQIENILKKMKRNKFEVLSNPEFLREGEAIRDFRYPDRIVVGANNKKTFDIIKRLYQPLINKGAKFFVTSRRGAELIKYASNAFLATKITFINELSNLCEKANINIEDISLGMGSDLRIGSRFLRAGPAYGGSCFPKDTKGLVSTGIKYKTDLSIVKAVIQSNNKRKILHTKKIVNILKNKIKNKKIAFLGVTFKPNTDDMRDSTSLTMIPYLLKKGAIVSYYDPTGVKKDFQKLKNCHYHNDIKLACKNADLIILHTEWDEFKSLDFKKLSNKNDCSLYDLRNLYDYEEMLKKKIIYYSIGRPPIK
ncbi:UDP-glucose/GDP-mannose dehydrogenase family protein [Pelagibacteraceae bacterium]|nr:UDP-glucose/GDP-mannose dehydrogenase family protein [Pelagibacteraceae bacterium]